MKHEMAQCILPVPAYSSENQGENDKSVVKRFLPKLKPNLIKINHFDSRMKLNIDWKSLMLWNKQPVRWFFWSDGTNGACLPKMTVNTRMTKQSQPLIQPQLDWWTIKKVTHIVDRVIVFIVVTKCYQMIRLFINLASKSCRGKTFCKRLSDRLRTVPGVIITNQGKNDIKVVLTKTNLKIDNYNVCKTLCVY